MTTPATPNKTDAGNGSNGICRVIDASRSPSPDPRRSRKKMHALKMTQDEEASLRVVIEDYETRTETQRSLALAVLRGYDTFESASAYLKIPEDELAEANRTLWGILLDSSTGKLWIK